MKASKYLIVLLSLGLSACSFKGVPSSSNSDTSGTGDSSSSSSTSSVPTEVDDGEYVPDPTDETIYLITDDTLENGTYSDTDENYTFSISGSNYTQVYVNAPDKAIVLELNGVSLTNSKNSPIFVQDCDEIDISAKKNTTNNINDTRPIIETEYTSQGKGAIWVENGDLKLKGAGTLNITANYNNGVHCKDDVKIQKQTLNITAVNHGIRGNDSVTITSGTINISCGGDGLHSENSDISSKGKQKGNVTINGGSLTINSWSDAIQAAYNAVFEQTDSSVAIEANFKTNKYSSYDGDIVPTSSTSLYLKMSSSVYSNGGYTYAAYINGQWYPATYKGTQESGGQGGFPGGRPGQGGPGGSTYYIYEINRPNDATSFTLYRFQGNNVTNYSTTSYNAVSDAKAFNDAYDTVQIQSISGSKISFGSWGNYSSGNNNGADVSAKGIKANNEIYIKDGEISIEAYDDAIHANNDEALDNGATALGNVNISGGNLKSLKASDDGIHADGQLNISGGETHVVSSYEGLEGNVINISGGNTYVYGTDDGVNATAGTSNAAINITGGFLDVEVPTNGDTDGIDSNGTLTIDGGTVIVKGPGTAGQAGSPSAAVDTDGAVTIRSGSLIVFGGIERNPTSSVTRTLCTSSTVAAGSHTVSFTSASYSTTLKSSSRGCLVYSSLGTATLN